MEVLGNSAPTLTLFEGAREGDSRAVEGSSDRLATTTIPVSLFTTSAEAVPPAMWAPQRRQQQQQLHTEPRSQLDAVVPKTQQKARGRAIVAGTHLLVQP
jgi:hypothetical protein